MNGELKKFKIEGYDKIDYSSKVGEAEFLVMFNPSSYSQKHEVEYEEAQGKGTSASEQKYKNIKPREFTFEFIIDGTGVSSEKKDVSKEVDRFLKLTGKIHGPIHRPLYLKIHWGNLTLHCILKSATINYNLFKPDGFPLRAKINATFAELKDDKKRTAEDNVSSPDLTHVRVVHESNKLPIMVYKIYGKTSYYLDVARKNNLTNFRNLKTGIMLQFPPLKQKSKV